jgi:hypothetical protein
MDHIRPFVAADVSQVVRLHQSVVSPRRKECRPETYRDYVERVFVDNPSRDDATPSLVYQESDGQVVGFLGVVPRRMSMHGEPLKAAICPQFTVSPSCRRATVAVQLAGAFLDGAQDVSISDEASDESRRLWEQLGGTTALLQSIYWTRSLRPPRSAWSRRMRSAHLTSAPFTEDLSGETVRARLPELAPESLRVEYDDHTFEWLMERATERRGAGTLHKAVVRNGNGVSGWYVYHHNGSGAADVLQIAARPDSAGEVVDHLFCDAWQRGATTVTGRLEPRLLEALSSRHCFFHHVGPWVMVNTKRRELLRAFQSGDTFFSRFDGEWCLRFLPDSQTYAGMP